MNKISLGKKLPNTPFITMNNNSASFKDYLGKRLVLYFYPRDNTPGCTIESNDFQANYLTFKRNNAEVLGVSRDTIKSHCNFRDKFGFKFDLISDTEEDLCRLFDVIKEKNMYGKKVMGIERSTFIIDEHGRLAVEFRKVKAKGHVDEVLSTIKEM